MAGDDVTITVRANNGDAIRAFRDVNGQLRDMRGRFVSDSSIMTRSMNQIGKSVGNLKAYLIPLASAGVPVIASLGAASVKTAGSVGGATVAVAAFGAAVAGQVSHLSEAADAQKKYEDAVVKSGRGSKEAADAQRQLSATLARMPNSTARVAVAMQTLKGEFQEFSDSTADFTMTPVEKSLTVLGRVLPKLTPMAKGASAELDRLVTVAGGAVASPGFDALADRFGTFANQSLKDAVDGIIHFARALSEGEVSGPVKAFMDYAEQNGPAVQETLANVGAALTTLAEGAADAGPGMLTLVNAAAGLVASFPPELVTVLLQTAVALKAVSLAGAGTVAVSGVIAAARVQIAALGATSVAAGGGLAGLRAAFLSLGTAAKASVVSAGVIAVGLAVKSISDLGQEAPPNIDRMTASVRDLGRTGKVSGEAARVFGKDLGDLVNSFDTFTDNKFLTFMDDLSSGFGLFDDGELAKDKEKIDAFDDSLTNLVKSGNADVAKSALKRLSDEADKQGKSLGDVKDRLDGYKSALADQKFEQELVAESMGIFGQAAQDTSAKLETQKSAADGLRASLLALNDVNRSAYDAQIGFEGALDGLTASFKEHGATLDIDTAAGRANGEAMSTAAKAHDEMLASGLAAGESLGSMGKKSDELRAKMMELATATLGSKTAATEYVNTLLGTPESITTTIKAEKDEAIAGLRDVQTEINETPDAKKVTVSTLNGAAIAALEAVGLKTKQLPDGKTAVYTANGKSLGSIGAVLTALSNLNGKTANTYTNHYTRNYVSTLKKDSFGVPLIKRDGGTVKGYADGGNLQHFPNGGYIEGPGGPRSDSILATFASGATAAVSDTEYVVQSSAVKKYGVGLMDALNAGRLKVAKLARGGMTQTMKDARSELRNQFGISHFGQRAGYGRTPFEKALGAPSDMGSLVSALNAARGNIKRATSGGTETRLLRLLNSAGAGLIKYEKNLTAVNKSLEKAKDKLDSLKSAASQLRDSVKSGVLSAANITRGASGDRPMTVRSIMGGLIQSRDKSTAFVGALKDLTKRGLDKGLLKQVAEAGIEGGGLETAGALLRASSSEIASLNDLQSQIAKAAGSAGSTAADAFYGAAIKAQDKLVKSLQKQQDKLEKSMDRLAKSLEKAISRAIGGKAAGGIIGAAAGGPRGGLTWVGEQGPELVRLPYGSMVHSNPDSQRMAGSWGSMLTAPGGGRSRMPGYGGGGQPIIVQQTITLDGRVVAQQVFEPLKREVRNRGGLEAAFKTTR